MSNYFPNLLILRAFAQAYSENNLQMVLPIFLIWKRSAVWSVVASVVL